MNPLKTALKAAYFINGGWVLNQDGPNVFSLSYCAFLNVFVTMALVIERKKLAPEARKQRRASERLKMTSKSLLYFSESPNFAVVTVTLPPPPPPRVTKVTLAGIN